MNPVRFDDVIQFYDNIIFNIGIKNALGKDAEKSQDTSGSDIDFKTDSENNLTQNGKENILIMLCNQF
jgi:hypothetical protein